MQGLLESPQPKQAQSRLPIIPKICNQISTGNVGSASLASAAARAVSCTCATRNSRSDVSITARTHSCIAAGYRKCFAGDHAAVASRISLIVSLHAGGDPVNGAALLAMATRAPCGMLTKLTKPCFRSTAACW